jgi:hypothetical protein
MKLELKNLKHLESNSQATHCYTATLYVDGKPFAYVSNSGRGEQDCFDRHENFTGDFYPRLKEVSQWCANRKPVEIFHDHEIEHNIEMWCCEEVNRLLTIKECKKCLRNIFLKEGNDLFTLKIPYRAEFLPEIQKKWPDAIVLNALPFEKALEIFNEVA